MNRFIPARFVSPVVWAAFSVLFFMISIGGLTRLSQDHRTAARLEQEIRDLSVDLFDVEALLTSLRGMEAALPKVGARSSSSLSEYQGWRIQGASVLNDLQGRRALSTREAQLIQAIGGLFSYLEGLERMVRGGSQTTDALLSRGVSTQLYSLLTRLTRQIHEQQTHLFLEREQLSNDRQITVFLLIFFVAIGLLSFVFSNFLSSRTKRALQFQVGLLDQFILTGSAIKDWRNQIRKIMSGLSKSVGIKFLFVLFPEKDSPPACEVFWQMSPSESDRVQVESLIRSTIEGSERLNGYSGIPIRHKEGAEGGRSPQKGERFDILSRTLLLKEPHVVGMAGIGIDRSQASDPVSHQVFEGILSSLLSLLGSVRAIAAYMEKLEYYAARDPLTNLYNQRIFWDLLNYEVGRSERHGHTFALMVIDLDDFKRINDSFGHKVGDQCLMHVAELFRRCVRKEDILFRYGGDEFCIILPDTGIEQGWATATRIIEGMGSLSVPLESEDFIGLSVSIGIASWPQHARDGRELFLMADNMMYKAKRAGKNQCAVPADSDLAATFRHEGDIYLMLRKAVSEERFVPFFQPIYRSDTGVLFAHEVLVRLPRLDRPNEMMPAFEFIEVMERTGLVSPMDSLVRRKAFSAHVASKSQIPLFLNLSPNVLVRQEGLEDLKASVLNSGIDPAMVVFEITERQAVGSLEELMTFMKDVRQAGMRFAIDDFGSGFASFDYLRELPVSFVKIGGEIVRNLGHPDHVDRLIVESLVRISKRQQVQVIAETIECKEVLNEAKLIGVPLVQGFFVGRPRPDLC